jgi:uncharacterized protein (TIGR03435 family)
MSGDGLGQAQGSAGKPPVFDVVSIKASPFDPRGNRGINPSPGGRVTITNAPPQMLIGFAYEVRESEISGAPKWFSADGYDIAAKADSPISSPDQLRLLIRSLLADRFQFSSITRRKTRRSAFSRSPRAG